MSGLDVAAPLAFSIRGRREGARANGNYASRECPVRAESGPSLSVLCRCASRPLPTFHKRIIERMPRSAPRLIELVSLPWHLVDCSLGRNRRSPTLSCDNLRLDLPMMKRCTRIARSLTRGSRSMSLDRSEKALAKDPVCGMSVDGRPAKHLFGHNGKTYFFFCDEARCARRALRSQRNPRRIPGQETRHRRVTPSTLWPTKRPCGVAKTRRRADPGNTNRGHARIAR